MKDAAATAVLLSEYQPPAYLIDQVHLTFQLDPTATRVVSRISFRPNPDTENRAFFLNGEGLQLIRAMIDGHPIDPVVTPKGLTCPVPEVAFEWEAEVEIDPSSNTSLEGLYMSGGMYCTQCEAEGFRKITFYPDRPDVMATFSVRIEGDAPVLLSNGNPVAKGDGWAEWHDPWPKSSYLFALVAGNLVAHSCGMTTRNGDGVALNIWVRPGDEGKCAYALDALIRSMKWDEQVYGRAYDLSVFNLVAVDDFNAGAMENKGLNIFNSKYVLASPATATDRDYEMIEGIVAHEYFHNWTGNRITCRDWFQLCLKEGLTVFRDQQFSGDQRSQPVKRIDDVLGLRAAQFREDAGPLAHPVRPESYMEINNFYTATVYEKGAEVIGMLKRLVGDKAYASALDLYFTRHDGDAATIEDWLKVFEDVTGRDLTQFRQWYSQAGTPRVTVTDDFKDGTYTLHFEQETQPTPGQPDKHPQVLPIAVGLLNLNGDEMRKTSVLEMTKARQSFAFDGLSSRPIPSILRDFSAPVILERDTSPEERAFLLAHDTDPFNKWEASRQLAKGVLLRMLTEDASPDAGFLDALQRMAADNSLDPAFRAFALRLPSEDDTAQALADAGRTPDPWAIHDAHQDLKAAIAGHLSATAATLFDEMTVPGAYRPDAASAGRRALRLTALDLLTRADGTERAANLFASADNMTEGLGALSCLLSVGQGHKQLSDFYEKWNADRLVIDKWFSLQIAYAAPADTAQRVSNLTKHADFDWTNPNRFRSVMGALSGNTAGFHDPSGASYSLLADWLIKLDPKNPQTAARMATAFGTWRRYDGDRQSLIHDALQRIKSQPKLSPDMTEMVTRMLDG